MARPSSSFDLETYISHYASGYNKIQRLKAIAQRATLKQELGVEALRLAIEEARSATDTSIYRDLFMLGNGVELGHEIDEKWIEITDRQAGIDLENLRKNLEESRKQQKREVIRISHDELGEFYFKRGKFKNARGEYMRTRDYCSEIPQILETCTNVIRVNLIIREYDQVDIYVTLGEGAPGSEEYPEILAKLSCCGGLAMLAKKKYRDAATRFLSVKAGPSDEEMASFQKSLSEVMSVEDIAIYGSLCALATMSRKELKTEVIDNAAFHNILETMPEMRDLVHDFYMTKYSSCLKYLAKMQGEFDLDLYLGAGHCARLYKMIRTRALIQYIEPFVTVDLKRMAQNFNRSVEDLESELFLLIDNGDIQMRIDTKRSCLIRKTDNVRTKSLSSAVSQGQACLYQAEAMLLRMSLVSNDLRVSSSDRSGVFGNDVGLGPPNMSVSSADLD